MSVFFRPIGSNNVFNFFEDKDMSGRLKTISYNLGTDGSIQGRWEKIGTLKQLMGAIKSVETGKTEIISEADWNNLTKKVNLLSQRSNVKSQ
tara:strand:+ start:904 stop:1179 length:276 start_codon:yes stop_codon:yes gene_type:complete